MNKPSGQADQWNNDNLHKINHLQVTLFKFSSTWSCVSLQKLTTSGGQNYLLIFA